MSLNKLSFLDTDFIASVDNLELIARQVVEGFITGLHKSPFHGFSVEFSEHRAYQKGDSLRHLDWKVLARSERFYIKQYEEETNLRCHILLDISKSMDYGSGALSKLDYAKILAASLAYLMLNQKDATGLVLFANTIIETLHPRSVSNYLKIIQSKLISARSMEDTDIANVLNVLAEKIKRRSFLIIISDLLDDPYKVLEGIRHLRYNNHEVLVIQVLDRQEQEFKFNGHIKFEDLEYDEFVKTDARYMRRAYQQEINKHLKILNEGFLENNIDYLTIFSDEQPHKALQRYLTRRKGWY